MSGIMVDMDAVVNSLWAKNNDATLTKTIGQQIGMMTSALEHRIPELFFTNEQNPGEAVSAVKALARASAQGQRIYQVTSANVNSVLPALTISQEVKEEMRSMEGDPVVKRRRRQVQLELALQRIRHAVPRADVVVTNPSHLAIALRYDPERMSAPKVVAKGADYVALRIRQIAAAAGIPIVERRELARAMYDVVNVGQEVPERFYQAIAEILAYVYEMTGRGIGPRAVSVA
jgi:type III secretion system FlhB-like substrate exporter